jgi:hypothetical protein
MRKKSKQKPATKRPKKRPSKYEAKLKLNASFEDVIKMVVEGNPKSTNG